MSATIFDRINSLFTPEWCKARAIDPITETYNRVREVWAILQPLYRDGIPADADVRAEWVMINDWIDIMGELEDFTTEDLMSAYRDFC